ncbi:response regulator [Sutcliffiella deserti]|uniref:response regulator n=1 Tax=Sutcliffiella deserti TaxID=2875501 RepID=UPI001CC19CEE|nr:response regulator transcription factor [Sutcliffiella deserti]
MIRIVIAEDQELLLGAMGSLLDLEEDMEVIGLAANGKEALTLVNKLNPDVCLMDIEMPEMTGIEAAEALQESECKVMILTTFARQGYFQRAIEAGVSGYLLKDNPSEELAGSIRSIMEGKQVFSPELMDDISVQPLSEDEVLSDSLKQQGTLGSVKKYFSTIIDNMKLPAG